jgi:RimJ/RimL family protein N-acetyltransferase
MPAILPLMEIRTERLILRRPRLADLPAVVAACQDPDISRFIPFVPVPYGEDDGRAFLASVESAWEESDERTFAICGEDDVLIGAVTVRLREEGTVGYWLAPDSRGRGLMTEAVTAVVRWAREEQGIECLRLWTHPDNLASQVVAERAGFIRIGIGEHTPPFRDGTTICVQFQLRGHS